MRHLCIIVFLIVCHSCVINKKTNSNCNENEEFKVVFENHLQKPDYFYNGDWAIVSDTTLSFQEELDKLSKPKDDYRKALYFISKYQYISFQDTMNYTERLPYGLYLQGKVEWQKWYDENRCNNIQFIE